MFPVALALRLRHDRWGRRQPGSFAGRAAPVQVAGCVYFQPVYPGARLAYVAVHGRSIHGAITLWRT